MSGSFIAFYEGETYLLSNKQGLPSPCVFMLLGSPVGVINLQASMGGVPEITGTGYARATQLPPVPASGVASFSPMTWATNANTDWSNHVYAIALATTGDNTGKLICAWNLIAQGVPVPSRDLSQANTTEIVTPTLTTSS